MALAAAVLAAVYQRGRPEPPASLSAPLGSGAMFDAVAPYYDVANRVMSLGLDQGWRDALVDRLLALPSAAAASAAAATQEDAGDGLRVLDLGTGTADLAIASARRLPAAGARVRGVDPSAEMLARGRLKVAAANLSATVVLEEGDSQALAFADESFDRVSMAFAIRNVPNRSRALAEIARVLRAGGRVCILEFSLPDSAESWLGWLANAFVRTAVPFVGGLLSARRDEYEYLARSIADFPAPPRFAALLEGAGLRVAAVDHLACGVVQIYTADKL